MRNIRRVPAIINQGSALVLLIRIGITCLGVATLLYIFWPTTLNSFFESFSFRQTLVNLIKDYPGFDQDWLSVASLITVSVYLYGYLAITLVTANILRPAKAGAFYGSDGRDQWSLLSYVIVGHLDFKQQSSSSADYRNMPSVIRAYSKSREGIGSIVLDVISILAVSYIGYSSLQEPPSHGGLVTRIIDATMVGLWSYCIFSILMWFVFVFAAWFQFPDRNT